MKKSYIVIVLMLSFASACSKPLASARTVKIGESFSRGFAASTSEVFFAIRWAFVENGYVVSNENVQDGIMTTTWRPVTSDSHYVGYFDRKDFGVTSSYYQLRVDVTPKDGRTNVRIGSEVKTIVSNLKSSGEEERKILNLVGNYLRKGDPTITNLGIDE